MRLPYSDSEMSKPDGTILAEAVYEYEQSTGRNMVYMTLDGVTFSFDLNAQEVGPVSDADLDKVNAWLDSEDGLLVRQAGVAIVQQGQQEPANEALLTYYLVADTIGSADSSQAVLPNL